MPAPPVHPAPQLIHPNSHHLLHLAHPLLVPSRAVPEPGRAISPTHPLSLSLSSCTRSRAVWPTHSLSRCPHAPVLALSGLPTLSRAVLMHPFSRCLAYPLSLALSSCTRSRAVWPTHPHAPVLMPSHHLVMVVPSRTIWPTCPHAFPSPDHAATRGDDDDKMTRCA
jgi:hypothetical protein